VISGSDPEPAMPSSLSLAERAFSVEPCAERNAATGSAFVRLAGTQPH
jgi:hypothetical protein